MKGNNKPENSNSNDNNDKVQVRTHSITRRVPSPDADARQPPNTTWLFSTHGQKAIPVKPCENEVCLVDVSPEQESQEYVPDQQERDVRPCDFQRNLQNR